MLQIDNQIAIALNEIELTQIHSSGPGGQNVNKVANGIHLRFDINSSSLPEACKKRIRASNDRRITTDGTIVIKATAFRSTEKNRDDALQRLRLLIAAALRREKKRIATTPGPAAKRKRLEMKQQKSMKKDLRRKIRGDD